MSQQFVGEIRLFPFAFAPRTWALCAGQLIGVQQNATLFALLGTLYGGDGTTSFALPDLRGRALIGSGTGHGASYANGQAAGSESVTLVPAQIPEHRHAWQVTRDPGDTIAPASNHYAAGRAGGQPAATYGALATPVTMAPTTIGTTGASRPHDNMQPFTVLNYCIALEGTYPSRN
ncbi:phage tail protein [Nostoc sp. 3335mG]|nr:phage tail protein [Nostoc sp. 3335mG]